MKLELPLPAELEDRIVYAIVAGGYAHIAAQAAGVPLRQWRRWLALGRRPTGPLACQLLYHKVQQARAVARLKIEIEARDKDPRFWLKTGPGKDPEEGPGWSTGRAAPPRQRDDVMFPFSSLKKLRALVRPYLNTNPRVETEFDQLCDDLSRAGKKRRDNSIEE
jgi:hypothetical protein